MCTICLAGVFEDGFEQKCHENKAQFRIRGHGLKCETFTHVLFTQPSSRTFWLMALSANPVNPEVWNWLIQQEFGQECTCLQFLWKRGNLRWGIRTFSCMGLNIYGNDSIYMIIFYMIIFLTVISKVLFFNRTHTSLDCVQWTAK